MVKELPGYLRKSTKGDRPVYTIVASHKAEDRDREVVEPTAFEDLSAYRKNPVILFAHDHRAPAIGKAVGFKTTETALELDITFAETALGKDMEYLYAEGFMSAFSIGFIPKEWEPMENGQRRFTKVELVEVSAVPVPANALALMVRSGDKASPELVEYRKHLTLLTETEATEPTPTTGSGQALSPVIQKARSLAARVGG